MFKKSKKSVTTADKQNGKATFLDIMAAANRQFSSMGFNKVTMEEIANEAGLGKASLYYYFPDKDALFYAVLSEEYNLLEAGMKEILSRDVAASVKLKQYVEVRFQYFSRLLNLNVMEQKNSGKLKPVLTKMYAEFRQQELSLLVRVFREGKDSGQFRIASAGKTAEAFLHTMSGLRVQFLHHSTATVINSEEFAKLKKEINLVVDIFIRGISA
jgi:TetR/AcrR family transcriptional repressor of mexJK operon